jgi:pyruvate carboxylase subunit B
MKYFVTISGTTHTVELGGDQVLLDGEPVDADLSTVPGTNVHSLILDGASHRIRATRQDREEWQVALDGRRLLVSVVDERTQAIRDMTGTGAGPAGPRPIKAPMPGLVVKVEVAPGDSVEAGQGMVIVEAMKMENELKAEGPGVVKTIHVEPGQAVDKDQVLVDFEVPEEG